MCTGEVISYLSLCLHLFCSQNNNRGGYNAGDKTDGAFSNEEGIYYEKFFMSGADARDGPNGAQSILRVEWTNQHGCGGNEDSDPHKLNCNLVMQFMCQNRDESYNTSAWYTQTYARTDMYKQMCAGYCLLYSCEHFSLSCCRCNVECQPGHYSQWAEHKHTGLQPTQQC